MLRVATPITVAMAIPPLILLPFIVPWNKDVPNGAALHTGEIRLRDANAFVAVARLEDAAASFR